MGLIGIKDTFFAVFDIHSGLLKNGIKITTLIKDMDAKKLSNAVRKK